MLFTRLFAAAAFVACAVAQTGTLQFTTLPSNVEVGKPVPIKWSGGDGSPVTITLKKGTPKDLKTVAVLSGGVKGDSFTWTPSEDLESGDDYALQISQGVNTINYTGQFSVKGGTAPSASASDSSASDSATSTATVTVKSSSTVVITSVTFASTGSVVVPRNTTMVSPTLTRTGGGISAGTSIASQTSSGVAASTSSGAASNIKAQVLMGMGAFAAAALAL